MPQDQIDHYHRRAEEARLLAEHEGTAYAQRLQLELARNYDLLADNLGRPEPHN